MRKSLKNNIQLMKTAVPVVSAKRTGEVYRLDAQGNKTSITRKPLTEYVNSVQVYNTSLQAKEYQNYFEKDPFTRRQNEIIRVVENSKKVQKEYSILKDLQLTSFITKYLYSLVDKKHKNGSKKKMSLIEFFKQCSKEEDIRGCYGRFCSGEPLRNGVDFKDLGVSKWDRVNWLMEKKILALDDK